MSNDSLTRPQQRRKQQDVWQGVTPHINVQSIRCRNIIHGSDSVPSAEKEIGLWFKDGTIKWQPSIAAWVYENPQADE